MKELGKIVTKAIVPIVKNELQINPVSLTLTRHPNSLTIAESGERPTLMHEIKDHENEFTSKMINMYKNKHKGIKKINSWVGTDMDRHRDERSGLFLYSYLMQVLSIAKGYKNISNIDIYDNLILKLENSTSNMFDKLNSNAGYDLFLYDEDVKKIANEINTIKQSKNHQEFNLFPIDGIDNHYRISSSDLETENGLKKIKERLDELNYIKKMFNKSSISELIIADCTSIDHIEKTKKLVADHGLNQELTVVPLIEDAMEDDLLSEIIKNTDKTIMIAGSDLTQRYTWVGTMMSKAKMQLLISDENKRREKEGIPLISLRDGTGSDINRNGGMYRSRMGAILEGIDYDRTVQGQQLKAFANDSKFQKEKIEQLSTTPRCSEKDLQEALDVLNMVYQDVSRFQLDVQQNPQYTKYFDVEKVHQMTNTPYGSRYKKSNIEDFNIKDQRAITQSMVNNTMGFHPEMLFWDKISEDTINAIVSNISNPAIIDMLNQYTATHQKSDIDTASKYIIDQDLLNNFKSGYNGFSALMEKIKSLNISEDLKEKINLFRYNDIRPAFNIESMHHDKANYLFGKYKEDRSPVKNKQLLQRNGCGFSTDNKKSNMVI
jgi:hypothetical protein